MREEYKNEGQREKLTLFIISHMHRSKNWSQKEDHLTISSSSTGLL